MKSRFRLRFSPAVRGFSLFEALAAIAVIGILSWIVVASQSNIKQVTSATKLESDVATINHAIKVYVANGGSLHSVTDPQAILDKMKRALSAEDDAKQVGFGGAMIDPRLAVRCTTEAEAQSSTKRALWNPAKFRFDIATSGAGVAEFVLDDAKATQDYGTDSRLADHSAVQYNADNGWVWKYDPDDSVPPRAAPTVVALNEPGPSGNPGPSPAPTRTQLLPPALSQPGGAYALSTFDLSLSLADPNTSCSSWIMVSLNGGSYTPYSGPLSIHPDTQVAAFVAGDPKQYFSSGRVEAHYGAKPLENLSAPNVTTSHDRFGWGEAETVLVTLQNPNDPTVSSLEFQIDGGAWTPYASPFQLSLQDHMAGAAIVARAQPLTVDYRSSPEASAAVQPPPAAIKLQTPTITPSTPNFMAGSVESISVTVTSSNAAGCSLEYRLAGGAWTAYSSAFNVTRATYATGLTVEARARATSPAYTDSTAASATIGLTPAQLLAPQIALSSSKFDATISTITVTLTNPNPAGRSALFYAIKKAAEAYPPLSSFVAYTGPIQATVATYPDGFQIQTYAKSLDSVNYRDSDPAEGVTMADFFGVGLQGDILFVLDASGSMSATFDTIITRFARIQEEAIKAISSLTSTQKFAVIAFNTGLVWSDGSNDLKSATPLNKLAATAGLLTIHNSSGTNYEIGLRHAVNMITKPTQIIFLSDGLPNQRNYLDELATVVQQGIKINTIGLGSNQGQVPLQEMANLSGGTYTYVANPEPNAAQAQAGSSSLTNSTSTSPSSAESSSLTANYLTPNAMAPETSVINYDDPSNPDL